MHSLIWVDLIQYVQGWKRRRWLRNKEFTLSCHMTWGADLILPLDRLTPSTLRVLRPLDWDWNDHQLSKVSRLQRVHHRILSLHNQMSQSLMINFSFSLPLTPSLPLSFLPPSLLWLYFLGADLINSFTPSSAQLPN